MNPYRYRGRHRAPSTTGRTAARIVTAAAVATALPAGVAGASPPGVADAVTACESGDDFTAQNTTSSASGAFQFLRGTWQHFGGGEFAPTAKQASPDEQTVVFERAYAANGLTDWAASRSCWSPKVGKHASEKEAPRHAAPTAPRHAAPTVYEVRRGDTLSGIAAAHHSTWQRVFAANRGTLTHPDRIRVGQHLHV